MNRKFTNTRVSVSIQVDGSVAIRLVMESFMSLTAAASSVCKLGILAMVSCLVFLPGWTSDHRGLWVRDDDARNIYGIGKG